MPSVRSRSSCWQGLRRSSSSHPSSRASARGLRGTRFEPCHRVFPMTGRSRGRSNWLRRRSATVVSLPPSRPTWASFGEAGRASSVPPPVSRHRDHVRGAGDRDPCRREVHERRYDESDLRGRGVLRRRNRVELVAISPASRAGARRVTAVDTLSATVEALCGDLSSIRAPRGTELNAQSWSTEAPLRMLLNNLDAEVAERPEDLVVYGGSGKAARNHEALRAIVRSLLTLGGDETLLVPRWATWDEFRRLEAAGLTMFGQMTAGSWIYIGTQGILQGTYQTFAAAAERHFGASDLAGRTILTAGLGGMGGAQPLAGTMLRSAILCIEVDPARIERR